MDRRVRVRERELGRLRRGQVAATALSCTGRLATAEEVGGGVVCLLSDRSAAITGQLSHVDGGLFGPAAWSTPSAGR